MKKELEDRLSLANMLMGIGILFTVVPVGFTLISLLVSDRLSIHEAYAMLGWAFVVVYSLLPLGISLFFGGFTWTVYLKRAIKLADEAEDEVAPPAESPVDWR